jgi:hypothetical protein
VVAPEPLFDPEGARVRSAPGVRPTKPAAP